MFPPELIPLPPATDNAPSRVEAKRIIPNHIDIPSAGMASAKCGRRPCECFIFALFSPSFLAVALTPFYRDGFHNTRSLIFISAILIQGWIFAPI